MPKKLGDARGAELSEGTQRRRNFLAPGRLRLNKFHFDNFNDNFTPFSGILTLNDAAFPLFLVLAEVGTLARSLLHQFWLVVEMDFGQDEPRPTRPKSSLWSPQANRSPAAFDAATPAASPRPPVHTEHHSHSRGKKVAQDASKDANGADVRIVFD